MGIMDLRIFNLVLMNKSRWKILLNSERTLQSLLLFKYGLRRGLWRSKSRNRSHVSLFWKDILSMLNFFGASVDFMIGKYSRASF